MRAKHILSITEARRTIFDLANDVQKKVPYYTLTEFGRAKIVLLGAETFERLLERSKRGEDSPGGGAGADGHGRNNGAGMLSDGGAPRYGNKDGWREWDTALLPVPVPWVVVRDALRGVGDYHHEHELIKAQLYVHLVERHGYPVRHIDIGKYVRLGSERSKKFVEVDIVVNNEDGKAELLFAALPKDALTKDLETTMEELFDVAREIPWSGAEPNLLICFTRYFKEKTREREEKVVAVDYGKFKSFTAWKKFGMPTTNVIPKYKKE